MAWIELHTVLIRHRKVNKLARNLNIPPVLAVGHLVSLWGSVLELAEDGNITKWDLEDIAVYSGWTGDPKPFYAAMINGGDGFIDEKGDLRLVHDWWDYAGKFLTTKYRNNDLEKLNHIRIMYEKKKVGIAHKQHANSTHLEQLPNQPNQPNHHIECKNALSCFYDQYKRIYGIEPIKTKTDEYVMKPLLKQVPLVELNDLIVRFFDSKDQFIVDKRHAINIFPSQLNKLRTQPVRKGLGKL